jgi:hypothetical protein
LYPFGPFSDTDSDIWTPILDTDPDTTLDTDPGENLNAPFGDDNQTPT